MAKKMLTVQQAAERLEISDRGVVHLIKAGKLPAEREPDGRRWLIGAKELTDCIRERSKAGKEREKKRMAAEKAKAKKNAPVRKLPSKPAAKPARKRGLK